MSERGTLRSTLTRLSTTSLSSDYFQPDILCPLAEERNLYLTDDKCFNCSTKFNVPGVAHSKKDFCRFCYRGMCGNCMHRLTYFHQELEENQPICQQCIHKVTILSLDFQNEIQKNRLERLELRKEISLAITQRIQITKERQDLEYHLTEIKKSLGENLEESLKNIEILKITFERNNEKVEALKNSVNQKTLYFRQLIQEEKEKSKLNSLNKSKLQKEKIEQEMISSQLLEVNRQVNVFKRIIDDSGETEEVIAGNIENLISSITELQEKYEDVTSKINQGKEIQSFVVEEIGKNQEKIDELNKKLEYYKKPLGEMEFSQIEIDTLNKLKMQIKELDEIIKLKEERKTRHYSIYRKDHTHAKIPFTSLEEVPIQKSSENSKAFNQEDGKKTEKNSCCRVCIII
jgi:DNA repair exonuclease SbcCD ATPase subunit